MAGHRWFSSFHRAHLQIVIVGLLLVGCATPPVLEPQADADAAIDTLIVRDDVDAQITMLNALSDESADDASARQRLRLISSVTPYLQVERTEELLNLARADAARLGSPDIDLAVAVLDVEATLALQDYSEVTELGAHLNDKLGAATCKHRILSWCGRAENARAVVAQATGDLESAETAFASAADYLLASQDPYRDDLLVQIDAGRAVLAFQRGDTASATQRAIAASQRAKKRPDNPLLVMLHTNTAAILSATGDIPGAERWTAEAAAVCARGEIGETCDLDRLELAQANMLQRQGRLFEAVQITQRIRARQVAEGRQNTSPGLNVLANLLIGFSALGAGLGDLDDLTLNKETIDAAVDVDRSILIRLAAYLTTLASNDPDATPQERRDVIAFLEGIVETEPVPQYRAALYSSLADQHLALVARGRAGSLGLALDYARQAADLSSGGSTQTIMTAENDFRLGRAEVYAGEVDTGTARIHETLQQLAPSDQRERLGAHAVSISEYVRDWPRVRHYANQHLQDLRYNQILSIAQQVDPRRIVRRNRSVQAYLTATHMLDLRQPDAEIGFQMAQQVFASNSAQYLRRALATRSASDAEMRGRLAELDQLLLARRDLLTNLDTSAFSDTDASQALTNLANTDGRLIELETELLTANPDLSELAETPAESSEDVSEALRDEEVFLQIVTTDTETHLFVVNALGELNWKVSDLDHETACRLTARVRAYLDDSNRPVCEGPEGTVTDRSVFDANAARDLYDALIAPIETQLAGARTLIIAADGPIAAVPFAGLIRRPDALSSEPDWLIRRWAVSRIPDADSLVRLSHVENTDVESGIFGVGAPCIGLAEVLGCPDVPLEDGPVLRGAVRGMDGNALPHLPGALRELRSIRTLFEGTDQPTTILTGSDATEAGLRSLNDQTYESGIIATHFVLQGEYGAPENGLIFSLPSSGGEDGRDDGFLAVSEIVEELTLNVDLLILAGCNSASSKSGESQSIFTGFAEPFFIAGARGLLMSHFQLRDDVSSNVTLPVLTASDSVPLALQKSVLDLIDQGNSDPRTWTGFVYVGR
ncbi:MAG: CHAT domain-containing protein [Pseudomonadota bacterium]